MLNSSVVHGGLIDLSTAARGIDLDATGITGFQHLDTQHHRARAQYTYDALSRVTQAAYGDQTIFYNYDAGINGKGRLTSASDSGHSLVWQYDALGRVIGKTQTLGNVTKTVAYTYSNGNLVTLG